MYFHVSIYVGVDSSFDDGITWTEPHLSAVSQNYVVSGCTGISLAKAFAPEVSVGALCVEFKGKHFQVHNGKNNLLI